MNDLEKIISLAREQIGVSEQPPGSNNVIYNTAFYGGPVNGDNFPWCCAFIWWLFNKADLSRLFCDGQKTAYCPFVESWAKANGAWVTDGYRPGDLALYDWDADGKPDHIGLIVSVTGNALTTIEGNTGDAVKELTRSAVTIMGAYRPEYAAEQAEPPKEDALDGDVYTVKNGDSLWRIAEKFLGDPWRYPEIMAANGMTTDTIHPGQVLVIPGKKPEQEAPKLVKFTAEVQPATWELLRIMAEGNHLTIGQVIDKLLEDAI